MTPTIDEVLGGVGISGQRLEMLRQDLQQVQRPRYTRLWAYYSNPSRAVGEMTDDSERPYRQAQEWGMPARITGYRPGVDPISDGTITDKERKEVVVENDIAWRVDTMVDYLFGTVPVIHSLASDEGRRAKIQRLLGAILQHNGGIGFLQQLGLLGVVYGFVDCAVTLDAPAPAHGRLEGMQGAERIQNIKRASGLAAAADTGNTTHDGATADPGDGLEKLSPGTDDAQEDARGDGIVSGQDQRRILEMARLVSLQAVEPARALAILDPADQGRMLAYAQIYDVRQEQQPGPIRRLLGALSGTGTNTAHIVELWTSTGWWRWRDDVLEASGGNTVGRIPVVHVQNSSVPFAYSGASDVEALLPLQDELNTRLSDRAHRIAMQSFRMYLGKCIDNFTTDKRPAPGQVWESTNPDASIQELGGDASCESEQQHIAEVREALDKVSGVPPVAAGAIRNRIGNLTSAAALRITLMSLLARTERKRAIYGNAIRQICEMSLAWLDAAGVFATRPEEREIEIHWPNPLPENNAEKLDEARVKLELGIAKEVVLRELGY